MKINARNVYYRNIRAVFNDAIDDEITPAYPFRKFKIKPEPTRKRSLSVSDLRKMRDAVVESWQVDIPKETIAAGLGHGNNTVADIYIHYDYKKVDRANRKIIDFVNSGEEEY